MIRLKPYYSWSQHNLWNSSKREYYKRYSLGEEQISNKFFDKGKELGTYIKFINENPELNPVRAAESMSTDKLLAQVGKLVPSFDVMEDELEVVLDNGSKVRGFVDSVTISNDVFLEYKTGKITPKGEKPWTQDIVDDYDQLKFYALMYWIKSGRKSIPTCQLIWIETQILRVADELGNFSHEELVYTGCVEIFNRDFIVSELVDYEKELIKSIEAIEDYEYEELTLDNDISLRYIQLKNIKKETEDEMNLIKNNVLTEMDISDLKYAASESGRFTISERKSWSYSDTLTATMDESKKFFNDAKKLEQKDGSAEYTISKSISFKEI